jgi:hypothetical protein
MGFPSSDPAVVCAVFGRPELQFLMSLPRIPVTLCCRAKAACRSLQTIPSISTNTVAQQVLAAWAVIRYGISRRTTWARTFSSGRTGLGMMTMTIEERVYSALRSSQPATALRALVGDLSGEGRGKAEIIELFENLVVQQRGRTDSREEYEDAILDVLDALRGWCHPAAELLPEKPGR